MLNAALLAAVVLYAAVFAQPQELNGTLTTGQSLLNGQTLVSAQKTFVLGFFPNGEMTYLGIWYNYMKPKSIVWVANRDSPITGGSGSLILTATSLDLLDRQGTKLWTSGTFSVNSPQAFLLDSGNLVVNDTTSGIIWQSFEKPCDSQLPGLRIGYDTFTNHNWYLRSWKSSLDPSSGDYYLKLDPNRLPDVLLFQGTQLKYRMGTWNGQGFSGVPALKANNQLAFNMTASDGSAYYSFTAFGQIHPVALCHKPRRPCPSLAQQPEQRLGRILAFASGSV
ncbi:hypothetical protein SETIT_1G138700v2 [Setaria italica]|uniref:non-specific serine/threonine protein kinase n=1 Tax=Setaria italica TaxID=4555 RepID=A0A368PK10_SETIT|nr:hypothetical protein SETIT_1G138700v2 [Setaria italica]